MAWDLRAQAQEIKSAEFQQALMASELHSLKTQLHAHFRFNALHGISTLTDSDPGRAKAMILKLSGLLPAALRYGDSDFIALGEELKSLSDYLDLERIRLGDRLQVRWNVRPGDSADAGPNFPVDLHTDWSVCYYEMSKTSKAPKATRRKILDADFAEFYRNGFQGGSLNEIVEAAKTTKGALFHHFAGKQELGYAVVGEIIGPQLQKRWMDPLVDSSDPIVELKQAFRRSVKEDIASRSYLQGCPLNNLAQEMSPLDQGFRTRIDKLYVAWRARVAQALTKGVKTGAVKQDISPRDVAALVVASQMGIWGTGKNSRDQELMTHAAEALCAYLDTLKP